MQSREIFSHNPVACAVLFHEDVIKWKQLPRYWPFVRRIHRSLVNSPHKSQWRGILMFSLICARTHCWVSNSDAADLGRHHYDDTSVFWSLSWGDFVPYLNEPLTFASLLTALQSHKFPWNLAYQRLLKCYIQGRCQYMLRNFMTRFRLFNTRGW